MERTIKAEELVARLPELNGKRIALEDEVRRAIELAEQTGLCVRAVEIAHWAGLTNDVNRLYEKYKKSFADRYGDLGRLSLAAGKYWDAICYFEKQEKFGNGTAGELKLR
jgi:hypothetical protein